MVRFTLYLEIIEKENLVKNANSMGSHLSERLTALEEKYEDKVSNVRNRGLFGAFDLIDSKSRDKLLEIILDEGAMMLGCGTKSIRFRPHLNITEQEMNDGFSMIGNLSDTFKSRNVEKVDLLIGSNNDEWSLYFDGNVNISLWLDEETTPEKKIKLLHLLDDIKDPVRKMDLLITAKNFVCPSLFMAEELRKKGNKTWVYQFNSCLLYTSPSPRD